MRDFLFLSGEFFEIDIPKDKLWLKRYFHTPVQFQFLQYYLTFNDTKYFKEYTGIDVEMKYIRRLESKYLKLLKMRDDAKSNFDIELLWKIESGNQKKVS